VLPAAAGQPVIGYLLAQDEQWHTILSYADRQIVIVPTRDVKSRKQCSAERTEGVESLPPPLLTISSQAFGQPPRCAGIPEPSQSPPPLSRAAPDRAV